MTKPHAPEPDGFAEFWQVWLPVARRNDGRGLARETFRKHVSNGAAAQDIVDGARWYIRGLKERDRDFVPLASTWLNREAYVDLCQRERDYQDRLATRPDVVPLRPPKSAFLRNYERRKGG